jgi:hypothetical protein
MFNSKHDMLQQQITKAIDEILKHRKEIDRLKNEQKMLVQIEGAYPSGRVGSNITIDGLIINPFGYSEIELKQAVLLIIKHLGLEIKKESKQERVYLEKKKAAKKGKKFEVRIP